MDAAITKAISDSGANSIKQMGAVVKAAKSALEGKTVDGKVLSDRVRDRLSETRLRIRIIHSACRSPKPSRCASRKRTRLCDRAPVVKQTFPPRRAYGYGGKRDGQNASRVQQIFRAGTVVYNGYRYWWDGFAPKKTKSGASLPFSRMMIPRVFSILPK